MLLLQARGKALPKLALINGTETGTLPVIIRQAQSMLFSNSDFKAPQQSLVGDERPPLLPVTKFKQGVKLLIMELLHAVLITCAWLLVRIEVRVMRKGRIINAAILDFFFFFLFFLF